MSALTKRRFLDDRHPRSIEYIFEFDPGDFGISGDRVPRHNVGTNDDDEITIFNCEPHIRHPGVSTGITRIRFDAEVMLIENGGFSSLAMYYYNLWCWSTGDFPSQVQLPGFFSQWLGGIHIKDSLTMCATRLFIRVGVACKSLEQGPAPDDLRLGRPRVTFTRHSNIRVLTLGRLLLMFARGQATWGRKGLPCLVKSPFGCSKELRSPTWNQ